LTIYERSEPFGVGTVLVVDDFEPFRQFVRLALAKRPELQLIGEAADGFEAVQKAAELKPDLILLDLNLPTMNGIEAARQIRILSPESRIIFLSQESSTDIVEGALRTGAWGYVVKARAGSELLAAVEAVRLGKKFVSLHIDIEIQRGVLLVTARGNLAFDAALRLLKQVCDTAKENEVHKILVNALALDGELSTLERYNLGVEMAAYLKQRRMNPKLAFVGKPPAVDGFGVRVGQNRGLITEVFSSQQEALNWLDRWPG
jgi:DNA-binding response OmpR family regulator